MKFEIGVLPPSRSAAIDVLRAARRSSAAPVVEESSEVAALAEFTGSRPIILSRADNPSLINSDVRVFREVTSVEEAEEAVRAGFAGVVAKGNEAGGRVGSETTFVLLQRLVAKVQVPIWAYGGIGPRGAAACKMAGAQGVILSDELALAEECRIPEPLRSRLAAMDGTETTCLGELQQYRYRVFGQENAPLVRELQQLEIDATDPQVFAARLQEASGQLYALGQGIGFAGRLASRHRNIGGIIRAYRQEIADSETIAARSPIFREKSAFAEAHGIEYPILQGPMTRVSDIAGFANAVAQGGGLPFLALALMRGPECERLLTEAAASITGKPWGVGILSFVPADLRAEQLKAVLAAKPKFAILAGGRPEQANTLEAEGIKAYIHTPSAQLLDMFLRQGARRFIFEGRECGGHVGPLSSFVLWESVLDVLAAFQRRTGAKETVDIVFAGGIHDARSTAMVASFAATVTELKVRAGVLMGTAYLFTQEAVETGSIVPSFQEEAVRCSETVLLEMGGGHAIRCAPSPYTAEFKEAQRRMRAEGLSHEEVRTRLEDINVGRLRIAAKGLARGGADSPRLAPVPLERQKSEGMFMIGQVAALREGLCSIRELHQTVSGHSTPVLVQIDEANTRYGPHNPEPVAIVGMSAHLPDAGSLQEYWANILTKRDCIHEVTEDRWPVTVFFDKTPNAPDRSISKWGGFIPAARFDPMSFGIPPATVSSVEPMHLLLLEASRKALADAGYDRRPFARENTGVVIGLGGGTWDLGQRYQIRCLAEQALHGMPDLDPAIRKQIIDHVKTVNPEMTEDSFPGILGNVAAGRVANKLDLGGPNYTVDAACACALAALETGLNELRYGGSDVMLVGAAEEGQNAFGYLLFSRTGALSPRGRCRPFDATADGIATSEGLAMVVLKRLADAERDGDRIYAVIRSIGSGSDGREKSLTAPAVRGQMRAVRRTYQHLEFGPSSVTLVEAHGTGTAVGDKTEMETLRSVWEPAGAAAQSCALGSVKSQIGHTKGAAGLAALVKVAMSLHNRVLPPSLLDAVAPPLRDRTNPLYVNSELRPWFQGATGPRRGAVSAFGFGGTNFHTVLEEYPAHTTPTWHRPAELFVFRGANRAELSAALTAFETKLSAAAPMNFTDLAEAVARQGARGRGTARVAIVAKDVADLRARLTQAAGKIARSEPFAPSDPVSFIDQPAPGPVAFLFPGQGSQYVNMLADLAIYSDRAREVFEEADQALAGKLAQRLTSVIFPPPAYSPVEEEEQSRKLNETWFAQPALGAANSAMFAMLKDAGIEPAFLGGHSFGEYTALCAANVMNFGDMMRLSERRGNLVQATQGTNDVEMLAVQTSSVEIAKLLDHIGVSIAGVNAPDQTIVGGRREAMNKFVAVLDSVKVNHRKLAMSAGFHIPEAQPAADRFAAVLDAVDFGQPNLPVYSNLEAAPYPGDGPSTRKILTSQLTNPLRFQEQIEAMYEAGARVFVEVGPGQVLTGLVQKILGSRPAVILASNRKGSGSAWSDYLRLIGWFYSAGTPVRLESMFAGSQRPIPDLTEVLAPPPAPRPTDWILNGAEAHPAIAATSKAAVPVRAATPSKPAAPVMAAIPEKASVPVAVPANATFPANVPVKAFEKPFSPLPQVPMQGKEIDTVLDNGQIPHVVAAFQATMQQYLNFQLESNRQRNELMGRFLDTQRAMVEAMSGHGPSNGGSYAPAYVPAYAPPPPVAAPLPMVAAPAPVAAPLPSQQTVAPPPAPQPATTPEPVLTAVTESAQDVLFDLISQRTGYPPEMLELDQNLEADLGIDSIKRAEIFGALPDRLGFANSDREREDYFLAIAKLRTMREVLDWLKEKAPSVEAPTPEPVPVAASVASAAPVETTTDPIPSRFLVRAVPLPLPDGHRARRDDEVVLLTEDPGGRARETLAAIAASGVDAAIVRQATSFSVLGKGIYEADLTDRQQVERLRDEVVREFGPVTSLCHFLPLDSSSALDTNLLDASSLFQLASVFGPGLRQVKGRIVALTALGGAYGFEAPLENARIASSAIPILLKSLGQEWPEISMKSIDLNPAEGTGLLVHILAELASPDERVEVGYVNGVRYRVKTYESPVNTNVTPLHLDEGSVVLVTGGARGITAAIIQELAFRFRPLFVIAGRSPLPQPEAPETQGVTGSAELKRAIVARRGSRGQAITPNSVEQEYQSILRGREITASLEALKQAGARYEYHSADARDEAALEGLIKATYDRHGRIDGVIHGAGIVEDSLMQAKSYESFRRVFDTKVIPALVLARALRPDSLRFLFFLSSLAARYGYPGGGDYSAANEVMNRLARKLDREWSARVCAIGWGPWAATGIASRYPDGVLKERGLVYHSVATGVKTFVDELLYGQKGEPEAYHYIPGSKPLPE